MFKTFGKLAVTLAAALTLSACAAPGPVSRDAPLEFAAIGEQPSVDWTVTELSIRVPETLSVSEANGIKPRADIVWREDPLGNRHTQVADIMREGLEAPLGFLNGTTPVAFDIEVTRFHALTERARYTIGGEHEIEFILTVRHAENGAVLVGPRGVDVTFRAYGGQQAVNAEARGITQRVRIVEHLADWVRTEFPSPPALLSGTPLTLPLEADDGTTLY